MNIGQLEAALGMTRANIRFYEKEGLLSPTRSENGYRDWLLRFAGIFRIQTVDFSLPAFAPPEGMRLYLDGLHPNREGHRLMADALCAALPPIHL